MMRGMILRGFLKLSVNHLFDFSLNESTAIQLAFNWITRRSAHF